MRTIAHLVVIFVFCIAALAITWDMPDKIYTTSVPCYDKYSNEIVGQSCIDTVKGLSVEEKNVTSLVIICSSLFFAIIFVILELLIIKYENE